MAKKTKTYRGQRAQKSYREGCGCFYCTGTDRGDINKIKEGIIDIEVKHTLNTIDTYCDIRKILVDYENFKLMTNDAFGCAEEYIDRFIDDIHGNNQ